MRLSSLTLVSLVALTLGSCRSAPEETAAPTSSRAAATTAPRSSGSTAGAPVARVTEASAPAGAAQEGGFLEDEAARLQRLHEKQDALSKVYIEKGDELLDRADLQGALEQFAQALEVKPSSQEARDRMRKVEALMGNRYQQADDFVQDSIVREEVKRAQARMAAEEQTVQGDAAMKNGDYAKAVEHYREAQLVLRYHPLIAEGSLDEQILTNKLGSATALKDEAMRKDERRREQEAREARDAAEREQQEYRANRLKTLYTQANDAYLRENYRLAETLARQILLEDPGNEYAIEMRDIAQSAKHQKIDAATRRDMHEQWIRTFEDLDALAVPQVDPIIFDDLERWAEVSARQPIAFSRGDGLEGADKQAILDRLDQAQLRPSFGSDGEGEPLAEVATFLQQLTGVNFLISPRVREDLDEEETAVTLDLPETSVRKVLDLIAEVSESVRWKIEDGVVKFVHVDELVGGQVLRMYEVRDLIHPVPDFIGREINVFPSGGIEPLDEDLEEREALVVTADSLETLIRDNVSPESWDADPANNIRITESGTMVVYQTPEVHEQISQLLEDLREATGIMVDIQARFLTVEDNFLEDIGIDFRGLGAPGLGTNAFLNDYGNPAVQQDLGSEIGQDTSLGAFYQEGNNKAEIKARVENLYDEGVGDEDVLTGSGGLSFQWTYLNDLQFEMILRAVAKSERVELVTAPNVLVFNTARANLTVLNQVAYVHDYDVEIAQAASIADPIVAVVQDGVVLDVRPVVSADRRFITLELRPTVAELKRPIEEFTTTLGTQSSVTIQLPELEIARVRTSVPMPDGGTVLLGGLKIHEQQDKQSGVPILNKIPILSFLFERKGTYVTNRKLLILLKANIVIPAEHEPTPAQLGHLGSRGSGAQAVPASASSR